MQALGGLVNFLGQRLESHGGVHKVAQDQLGRLRLAVDEQSDRLVEQCLRESGIFLHAGGHGLLEMTGKRHRICATVPCHRPCFCHCSPRLCVG